jgi:hypothetical protein
MASSDQTGDGEKESVNLKAELSQNTDIDASEDPLVSTFIDSFQLRLTLVSAERRPNQGLGKSCCSLRKERWSYVGVPLQRDRFTLSFCKRFRWTSLLHGWTLITGALWPAGWSLFDLSGNLHH